VVPGAVEQGCEQDAPEAVQFTRVDTQPVQVQPKAAVDEFNCPQQGNEGHDDECRMLQSVIHPGIVAQLREAQGVYQCTG